MNKDCSCYICKSACTHKPGWFMPGEVEKVAEYLGMPLQELFDEKLGVDWWVTDGNIFVLAPATTSMDAGIEYPGNPKGQCIFYENGLCSIHSVKPFECREFIHSEDDGLSGKRHKAVADAWQDKQAQIVELLGREPEAEETSIFDIFSWV